MVGTTVGVAGGLAVTEPFLFCLHGWFALMWWRGAAAAYFTETWLMQRENGTLKPPASAFARSPAHGA